jgi:hypothetical protein
MPCWEQSADGGRSWQIFSGAPTSGGVFQVSGSGAPWRLCSLVPRVRQQPDQINCTFDGGATWSQRASVSPLPASYGGNYASTTKLLGLAPDDAVIALDMDPYSAPARPATVYRLARGATHWQSLGPVQEDGVEYLTAPAPGALWAFPMSSKALDPQQRLFVAAYA